MVATSGRAGERFSALTASPRSRPCWICGAAGGSAEKDRRVAANGGLDFGSRAAELYRRQIEIVGQAEDLAGEVRGAASTRRGEAVLTWIRRVPASARHGAAIKSKSAGHASIARGRHPASDRPCRRQQGRSRPTWGTPQRGEVQKRPRRARTRAAAAALAYCSRTT